MREGKEGNGGKISRKIETEKIPSLFRDGKQISFLFRDGKKNSVSIWKWKSIWSQNLEGIYRATFRDGNLKTGSFHCLNRDGNNFPSLNRDGIPFPSLFRDRKQIPSLFRDGKINSVSIF